MARQIFVTGSLDISDDDQSSFEWCHYRLSGSAAIDIDEPVELLQVTKVCGGEVRVELDLKAIALPNGDARVTGTAKLYEGVSGFTTTDLDDQENIDFLLSADQSLPLKIKLENQEVDSDDLAEIKLTFENVAIEEVA
ncbi:LGFP repeat protein [Thalassoporum mexicanum PCC 7367]|uniref:hypothetical protein n=1 Tax=Thalassoporum mexicanum TaxID=3457544 RepID=UPI00029FFF5D|nr:hypothetical protein [Pseudanabaena sp. PCC 7367]AFY70747.1 LGFP repeat protein [Pseudanabaena sp. PCC 7367]